MAISCTPPNRDLHSFDGVCEMQREEIQGNRSNRESDEVVNFVENRRLQLCGGTVFFLYPLFSSPKTLNFCLMTFELFAYSLMLSIVK